jgi:hypothetical protein
LRWRQISTVRRTGALVALAAATISVQAPAMAQEQFPFDSELTMDAAPMRGSKRIPNLSIGTDGAATLELYCKGARGQFSVAGDTVIFIPGPVEDRNCPADRAAADDGLLAALAAATTWKRQGEDITFAGSRPLRFHFNSN